MVFEASLSEFLDKIFSLTYWEVVGNLHGMLAMLVLILFGAAIALFVALDKFAGAIAWFKRITVWLFAAVAALDAMGLFIYRAYRAKVPDSPRSILKSSPETDWLHSIVFEHKEFLAFVPLVILLTVAIIARKEGEQLLGKPLLRKVVLFSLIISLIYVLIVAAEAVLVTKAAPLK